jgi:serine/threonine-protein kinase
MHRVGRYIVGDAIGKGGMATVHLARMIGPSGFGRILAVKRLHPHLVSESDLVVMLLDEAKISARIRSPFVVQSHDVVATGDEVMLVMEYVHGVSLHRLGQRASDQHELLEPAVVVAIVHDVLSGLHVAHELEAADGTPLGLVHRDVSPQNVLVGADGVARILDFGVAHALGRATTTREGHVKGKIAYMAPEQLEAEPLDRRTDVFAVGVVLWEALTGKRLFGGVDEKTAIGRILSGAVKKPSAERSELSEALDAVVLKALARDPAERFATAKEMATALAAALAPAPAARLEQRVEALCSAELADRKRAMAVLERADGDALPAVVEDETKSAQTLGVPARRASSRAVPWLVAFALLLGFGVATYVVGVRPRTGPEGVASVPPPLPSASAGASTSESAAASASGGPSVATPPASVAPSTATAATTATALASAHAVVHPSARPSATAATKPDCTNPYELDAQGRRRYRRECLATGN